MLGLSLAVTILSIGENSVPVSGFLVGVGEVSDAETLEETVIVLAAVDVLTTKVLLLGITAMNGYNITICS